MREIGDYLSRELHNPGAALRLMRLFQETTLRLCDFPEMGAPLLAAGKRSAAYHYLVCGSYLMFYHTVSGTVLVDRVLYGRRDYLALLFGDELEEE